MLAFKVNGSAREEDLKDRLDAAIEEYPDTVAVLVRRHGIYGILHCY